MQEAVPVGKGGMLAIIGIPLEEIKHFIKKLKKSGVCEIANDNAEGQTIVRGDIDLIKELHNELKQNKKKSILLPVSAPFHCSLMNPASEKMKEKINSTKFKNLRINIISNVSALPESSPDKIKKLLIEQIYSKVRWRETILYMIKNNIDEFIEIGPGKVLSGLVKRIAKNCKSSSINSIEDIKNFLNESKK